jgi:hypothetical protein
LARLKNVSGEARQVPLLDDRIVEADEIIEVPDELIAHEVDGETVGFVWPESTWQVTKTPAKAKPQPATAGEEG